MTEPADPIDELASGYREAQILLAANRLGIFAALGEEEKTLELLARSLEADRRGLRIICDALVSLSLLEKRGQRYRNAPLARRHLIPDAPGSRVDLLLHTARLYERWGHLYDAVKSGRPVPDDVVDARLRHDPVAFARAMADVGRESARLTAATLDLTGAERLLDLGGGPGLYAIEFARREPRLHAIVLDRPETVEVARHNIDQAGLADRVGVRAGDIFQDDLDGPWDLILASNLIHIYPADANRRLVGRCARVLDAAGRLVIKDFFMRGDRTGPRSAALFAVNMLVSTEGGECHTLEDTLDWLEDAGLVADDPLQLTSKSQLLVARKPAAPAQA